MTKARLGREAILIALQVRYPARNISNARLELTYAKRLSPMKSCYRGTTVLNEAPMVAVIDEVLDTSQCRAFIELARASMQRAKVSLEDESGFVEGRTGSNTWLAYDKFEAAREFGERISALVGMPLDNAEAIQVIHYGPGQKYGAHFDAYELGTEKGRRCCKYGGQRLVTCLVYLNDVEEGGGTRFPKLDVRVSPQAGRMVIFHNVDPADYSQPHPASLHGGEPVQSGEKWAMNIWFHQATMRQLFDFDTLAMSPGQPPQAWYANRAIELFEAAWQSLTVGEDAPLFSYWDTWFGPEPEALQQHRGPVVRLVDRRISNRLADKGRLPAMLMDEGLSHLAPLCFASPGEALDEMPEAQLFYVKNKVGTAGQGVRCVTSRELAKLELGELDIVQQAITAVKTHEGRKFTIRGYVLISRGQVEAWPEGIVIVHGVPYDPTSADYGVQVDHSGYVEADSKITMLSTSALPWGELFTEQYQEFVGELSPVLEDVRAACESTAYSVLGLDLLLTEDDELKLIEINAHPNFIHTPQINDAVNIPMLRGLLERALGRS